MQPSIHWWITSNWKRAPLLFVVLSVHPILAPARSLAVPIGTYWYLLVQHVFQWTDVCGEVSHINRMSPLCNLFVMLTYFRWAGGPIPSFNSWFTFQPSPTIRRMLLQIQAGTMSFLHLVLVLGCCSFTPQWLTIAGWASRTHAARLRAELQFFLCWLTNAVEDPRQARFAVEVQPLHASVAQVTHWCCEIGRASVRLLRSQEIAEWCFSILDFDLCCWIVFSSNQRRKKMKKVIRPTILC